jgi:hypothetical protein
VKSLTAANERGQLRLGLGQVLDYTHSFQLVGLKVRVLCVERPPSDSSYWLELCSRLGVQLVWPDTFASILSRS